MSFELAEKRADPTSSKKRVSPVLTFGIAVVAAIVVSGLIVRSVEAHKLEVWTSVQAVPTVTEITPVRASSGPTLTLPARLQAYSAAPIFARVPGYLKSWSVDIGSHVRAGQELAVIETPELDQQLSQARADLATAQANAALAATTAKRWQSMAGTDAVAQQDVDERTSDYKAKNASVVSARANVERLVALKGFAHLVSPFNGVVTARDTDVGSLINAGNGAGQELFQVSDVRQLRVYVQVPQNYAPQIKSGGTATLSVPEHTDKTFTARVVASADAVDANSGTTLVQLLVDNQDGQLMPGDYASLQFNLPATANGLRVPASALIFDARGLQVATIGLGNRVLIRRVTIARDLGDVVEISSGLAATARVIDTPPDGLANGDTVRLVSATKGGPDHE